MEWDSSESAFLEKESGREGGGIGAIGDMTESSLSSYTLLMPHPVVFIGADHAGYPLKEQLMPWLEAQKHTVVDLSPNLVEGDDYPAHALRVARHVAKTPGARGILVCGNGVGMVIAANRVKKVRAFEALDEPTTKLAREHNDVNVVALSGWHEDVERAEQLLKVFFATKASRSSRHLRRIAQLG